MQIQLLSCTTSTPAGKKYQQAEVSYKNLSSGKIEGKKIVSFKYPDVFDIITTAAEGTVVNITSEKVDGYWTWTSASKGDATTPASKPETKGNASPKSTYETPEERAQKQIYIVRQSSISSALTYYDLIGQKKATKDDIVALAKFFESYVFDTGLPMDSKAPANFDDLEDDIPM